MSVRGTIKNGKVVLDDPKAFPEGTEVEVRPATKRRPTAKPRKTKAPPRTLAERFANVVGKATGLPPDASVNHDYLRREAAAGRRTDFENYLAAVPNVAPAESDRLD